MLIPRAVDHCDHEEHRHDVWPVRRRLGSLVRPVGGPRREWPPRAVPLRHKAVRGWRSGKL